MDHHPIASGSRVIYGLLGPCIVSGTVSRQIGDEEILFYKIQKERSTLSRSKKQDPAIWIPVQSAQRSGLRLPMTREQAEQALKVISEPEYYLPIETPWPEIQKQIEAWTNQEGGAGLAKALSFLYVLKNRQVVPTPDSLKLYDSVHKILMPELAAALEILPKTLDASIERSLKHKLNLDQ